MVIKKTPDETQLKAIESDADKLIINAGPGSGKTFVLIERVKYLINQKKVKPESLLIITFTEKAADELRYRLTHASGLNIDDIDQMQISTIHSACRVILKDYFSSGLEIIDDSDSERKSLFIKRNKEELGFTGYSTIPNNELKIVSRKFDEYSTFGIDTDKLEKYLIKKHFNPMPKLEKEYRELIDKNGFSINIVRKSKFAKRWTLNKHLAIVRAYKKYLELLDDIRSYDFNHLITKTNEYLKNPKEYAFEDLMSVDKNQTAFKAVNYLKENRDRIRFKNILVDEFQDTDAVQMSIFKLLIEGSESVTFVGDPDQSIFAFRGSNNKFLYELLDEGDFERIDLLVNYRTPENIVKFNEYFIQNHGRQLDKGEIIANKKEHGDFYYLDNRDGGEESARIIQIIKHLKSSGKISKYSDVGLLFRSKKSMGVFIKKLSHAGIDFHVQGVQDFEEYGEVNSIMLLLWYLTSPMNKIFNLKDFFKNRAMDQKVFNLDKSTRITLNRYKGTPDEFSKLTYDELLELGIENPHDLEFFNKLNTLKREIYFRDYEVLDIYYKLFEITGYIENKFNDISEEELEENIELLNLGFLSQKIYDFMETYDRFDLNTLFEVLSEYYTDYSSPKNALNDDDCVQLLTIHKAKGLEFPVVFLCSLRDRTFPFENRNFKSEIYITPDKFKYPEIAQKCVDNGYFNSKLFKYNLDEEFLKEEYRVIYVALTRTSSTLIISQNRNMGKISPVFNDMIESPYGPSKLTDITSLNKVESLDKDSEDDITLSFTSLQDYEECPHKYNLLYNYNFVKPQDIYMRVGSIVHSILNKINILAIDGDDVEKYIAPIIEESRHSNSDLVNNKIFDDAVSAVDEFYWQEAEDWDMIESEFPFTIKRENYNLKGQIDLMKNYDRGISLVDFKTTGSELMDFEFERYRDQLHFYYLALRENNKYKNVDEMELELFSVSDFEPRDVELKQEYLDDLEDKLEEVFQGISNKQYYKTNDISNCEDCLLKSLCCK